MADDTRPIESEPTPGPDTEEAASAPPVSAPPSLVDTAYVLLGTDEQGLVVLDASKEPWAIERLSLAQLTPAAAPRSKAASPIGASLASVTWLGCGEIVAGRTDRVVAAWKRDGSLIGQQSIPPLRKLLKGRLRRYISRQELYQGGSMDELIAGGIARPGPLVQNESGLLAMDPEFQDEMLYGEEQDCRHVERELRVELPIPGVAAPLCSATAPVGLGDPSSPFCEVDTAVPGWRCTTLIGYGPRDDECEDRTLGPDLSTVLGCIRNGDPGRLRRPSFSSSWSVAIEGYSLEVSWLRVCRPPHGDRLFVVVSGTNGMGCTYWSTHYLLDGCSVAARTSTDSEAFATGDLLVFGADPEWFVAGPTQGPLRFSRIRPSVIRAPSSASPRLPQAP